MRIDRVVIPLAALVCASGFLTSPFALLLGVTVALIFGNAYADKTKPAATLLMAIAIVGLGAGVPLNDIIKVGAHGIIYTVLGIGFTFALGLVLGKWLKVPADTGLLVTAGTAICGGSAIAAISQVIGARAESIAVSLGTVFLLNATALIIFPFVGHFFDLTQSQFGLWAGLAIHDTSSVIGAALQYGHEATQVATTTKLARAIWIIPLAFIIGLSWKQENKKIPIAAILKRCWFIGGFLLMAIVTSYIPTAHNFAKPIEMVAKKLMVIVLFLIGLGMTRALLKQVGFRPFIQGIVLWAIVSIATLSAIMLDWISV